MNKLLNETSELLAGKITVLKRVQIAKNIFEIRKLLKAEGTTLNYDLTLSLFKDSNVFCKSTYHRYIKIGNIAEILLNNCHLSSISTISKIADLVGASENKLHQAIQTLSARTSLLTDSHVLAELELNAKMTPLTSVQIFQSDLNKYMNGLGSIIVHEESCAASFYVDLNTEIASKIWLSRNKDILDSTHITTISVVFLALIHHSTVITNQDTLKIAHSKSNFYESCEGKDYMTIIQRIWIKFFMIFEKTTQLEDLEKIMNIEQSLVLNKYLSSIDQANKIKLIRTNLARLI